MGKGNKHRYACFAFTTLVGARRFFGPGKVVHSTTLKSGQFSYLDEKIAFVKLLSLSWLC
jgi:hypothetical protein